MTKIAVRAQPVAFRIAASRSIANDEVSRPRSPELARILPPGWLAAIPRLGEIRVSLVSLATLNPPPARLGVQVVLVDEEIEDAQGDGLHSARDEVLDR